MPIINIFQKTNKIRPIPCLFFLMLICMLINQDSANAKESIVRVIYSGNHFGELEPCG